MKKLLLGAVAAVGLTASPAMADVFVFGEFFKTKTINVFENIVVDKDIDLDVNVDLEAEKFAESLAVVNQRNFDNYACENCAEKAGLILASLNDNSGIITANQAVGNLNNQGNAMAISIDFPTSPPDVPPPPPPPGEGGFAESQAHAEQVNESQLINTINILFRDAVIAGSGNNNSGLLYVNQASGNAANQLNELSLAVSFAPGVALSEADLGQFNTNNSVTEREIRSKLASIDASFNGNIGFVGVNQSAGNAANQANVVSFALTGATTVTPVP
jgi:hypothetical protein